MDGLLPIDLSTKDIIGQGILGALLILALWWIVRKEVQIKDLLQLTDKKVAEKDKTIADLQESRLAELRNVVPQLASNTEALKDLNKSVETQTLQVRQLFDHDHDRRRA